MVDALCTYDYVWTVLAAGSIRLTNMSRFSVGDEPSR